MNDIRILNGDSLQALNQFEDGIFDALITDPPYSSGGRSIGEKSKSTQEKYLGHNDKIKYHNFEGDTKDQRSWISWTAEWLSIARTKCKEGSPVVVFSDWRQYAALVDALQWAGWIFRGAAAWNKKNARPQKGRYRQEVEFILWGSKGAMPFDRGVPVLPGLYTIPTISSKTRIHQTEKPLELMRELVKICKPGGHILDPFAGSGTTLEAAKLEGYSATGIEMSKDYYNISRARLGL